MSLSPRLLHYFRGDPWPVPAFHYMTAVKEDAFSFQAPSEEAVPVGLLSARAYVAILRGMEIPNFLEDRLHAFQ